MSRVRKAVSNLPLQSEQELLSPEDEEERVSFEDQPDDSFRIVTDENFPGQFRVVGEKIEKVRAILALLSSSNEFNMSVWFGWVRL